MPTFNVTPRAPNTLEGLKSLVGPVAAKDLDLKHPRSATAADVLSKWSLRGNLSLLAKTDLALFSQLLAHFREEQLLCTSDPTSDKLFYEVERWAGAGCIERAISSFTLYVLSHTCTPHYTNGKDLCKSFLDTLDSVFEQMFSL